MLTFFCQNSKLDQEYSKKIAINSPYKLIVSFKLKKWSYLPFKNKISYRAIQRELELYLFFTERVSTSDQAGIKISVCSFPDYKTPICISSRLTEWSDLITFDFKSSGASKKVLWAKRMQICFLELSKLFTQKQPQKPSKTRSKCHEWNECHRAVYPQENFLQIPF